MKNKKVMENINEILHNLEQRVSKLEEKESNQLLTVKEVAKVLKVSPSVVYAGIRSGKLPAIDVMGLLRVRKSDLFENALQIKKYRQHEIDIENIKT